MTWHNSRVKIVSTDGSCLKNPGGAIGWAWVDHAGGRFDSGGAASGTNQIAELTAILRAIHAHPGPEPLLIESDSQYAINCATQWLPGWKRKGWRTASGKPVKNLELVQGIEAAMNAREGAINFRWVRGHVGNTFNERADELAGIAARDWAAGRGTSGDGSLLAMPTAGPADTTASAITTVPERAHVAICEGLPAASAGVTGTNISDDDGVSRMLPGKPEGTRAERATTERTITERTPSGSIRVLAPSDYRVSHTVAPMGARAADVLLASADRTGTIPVVAPTEKAPSPPKPATSASRKAPPKKTAPKASTTPATHDWEQSSLFD
ncbi:MAG: ribonuclease HI [Cellulomonadaceae bacterium]|nr:ribonuclease HI [Cellulomonadaceae bacterium]